MYYIIKSNFIYLNINPHNYNTMTTQMKKILTRQELFEEKLTYILDILEAQEHEHEQEQKKNKKTNKTLANIETELWYNWMSVEDFKLCVLYVDEMVGRTQITDDDNMDDCPKWLIRLYTQKKYIPPELSINHSKFYISRLKTYIDSIDIYRLTITKKELENIPIRIAQLFTCVMKDFYFYKVLNDEVNITNNITKNMFTIV